MLCIHLGIPNFSRNDWTTKTLDLDLRTYCTTELWIKHLGSYRPIQAITHGPQYFPTSHASRIQTKSIIIMRSEFVRCVVSWLESIPGNLQTPTTNPFRLSSLPLWTLLFFIMTHYRTFVIPMFPSSHHTPSMLSTSTSPKTKVGGAVRRGRSLPRFCIVCFRDASIIWQTRKVTGRQCPE